MRHAYELAVPERWQDLCSPKRTALIIYDMQAAIVPQIEDGTSIVAGCAQLIQAAEAAGFRVFYTRHLFLPNRLVGVGQLRRAMTWQHKEDPLDTKPFLTRTSPGFEIDSALKPSDDAAIIDKITMSAFEGTYLSIAMRDAQLSAFIIAGIALEVGIEPTIRQGLDLNFTPILVTDLCGAKTDVAKQRSLATLRETGEVFEVAAADLIKMIVGLGTNE